MSPRLVPPQAGGSPRTDQDVRSEDGHELPVQVVQADVRQQPRQDVLPGHVEEDVGVADQRIGES